MDRLPNPIAEYFVSIFNLYNIELRVVGTRKTKLGDWSFRDGRHVITINNDLVAEEFFMTLVHELAHALTWNVYGNTVKPHGKEWKHSFRTQMLPLLVGYFPAEVEESLREHMKNPLACSGRSLSVARSIHHESMFLEDVPLGISFKLKNGLLLEKIEKKRTRWVCKSLIDNKYFIVTGSMEVF